MKCTNCNNELIHRDQKKFCCRSCAVSYNNKIKGPRSITTREKTSKTLKDRADKLGRKHPKNGSMFVRVCRICKTEFLHVKYSKNLCSYKCQVELKRFFNKQVQAQGRGIWAKRSRSKGEKLLAEKLAKIGANVITNKHMFSGYDADIILPDYKLAIHWNGAWHWKPLRGEQLLKKIKARDEERYKAVEQAGYINLIIIDHKFTTAEQAADIHFRKLVRLLGLEPRPGDYLSEQV